ncbi:MAG: hypothetical protein IJF71_00905 [Clostridia bacterium]|nr:hypothetical protein [Clostridia bacterium]
MAKNVEATQGESAAEVVTSILQAEDRAKEIRREAVQEANAIVAQGEQEALSVKAQMMNALREDTAALLADAEREGIRLGEELTKEGEALCDAMRKSSEGKQQKAVDAIVKGVTSGTWLL